MANDREHRDIRLKRLTMRSSRRGIKEMDLILGAFARDGLSALSPEALDIYEAFLEENDHDLYQWITGQPAPPPVYRELIAAIARNTEKSGGI